MLFSRKSTPDHEERLTACERQLRALQVEWMDTLDRLKSMMGRIVKDRARAEEARGSSQIPLDEPTPDTPGSSLSARQLSINERILARRNRLGSAQ